MDKKRILIVEDNPVAVKVISLIIRDSYFNIQFDFVRDGDEAVRLAMNNHYEGIYMNLELPTITGIEACKLIRKHEKENNLKPVPIIAVTCSGDRKECLEAGIQAFIHLPFLKEDMDKFLSYCERYALNH